MAIRWISHTRRATQRLSLSKVAVHLAASARSRWEMSEALRQTVTRKFRVIEDEELKEWARTEHVRVVHPENDDTVTVEAQFYYLSRYRARSGWLSPKGVEEFVEVLPRRLGLLDDVYRRTEPGQILSEVLTPTEEHESWSRPSLHINPFRLSPAQAYFLLHAVVGADGDFILPWLRALVDRHHRAEFSYLEAGRSIPKVLESVETGFAGTAYLDSDRRQLAAIESARLRIEREIDAHLERLEEAKRRDHRKLGPQLDLFHFSEHSPASPLWHPKGMVIWNELERLRARENARRGYLEVRTPIIYDADTFWTSGHFPKYEDLMFKVDVRGQVFAMKSMNCILIVTDSPWPSGTVSRSPRSQGGGAFPLRESTWTGTSWTWIGCTQPPELFLRRPLTARPSLQTVTPPGVALTSGSRVRSPVRTTRLMFMFCSFRGCDESLSRV